jgi:hypothetical protein
MASFLCQAKLGSNSSAWHDSPKTSAFWITRAVKVPQWENAELGTRFGGPRHAFGKR